MNKISNDFGTIDVKPKCFYCDEVGPLIKEDMGYTWGNEWTCPKCGIKYRFGKGMYGAARSLYITIDQGEWNTNIFAKTAEWEKAGHTYEGKPTREVKPDPPPILCKKESRRGKQICPNCGYELEKDDSPDCEGKEEHHTYMCVGCKSFWIKQKGKWVRPRCECQYG